jgi:hypothetical protein
MGQHKADKSFCFFFQKEALVLLRWKIIPRVAIFRAGSVSGASDSSMLQGPSVL